MMLEFWDLFLHDAETFALTLWVLFIVVGMGVMVYYTGKDVYK